jgi:flagellar basal body P-ring protein FlgI
MRSKSYMKKKSPKAIHWSMALVLAFLSVLPGCMHQTPRLVAEEETERDRYGVRTLGEFCTVGNADPLPLGGIGLVVGLDGTGAAPTSDANRTMLEDDLRKQGVRNIKEMLAKLCG